MAIASSKRYSIRMECMDRVFNIPLIETSLKQAECFYSKMKTSNRFFNWYFETAELTVLSAYQSIQPAVKLFEAPLKRFDNVFCKSLDILEQHIPAVYLPPELMYWNTKEYMSNHLVKPVLKRADSVKQIGNVVLENSLTTYAAERFEGALKAGDILMDKYLLPIDGDQIDAAIDDESNIQMTQKGALKAIRHGHRFSRKLKRRLTQRTIAEARALKKQSKEAIHILIYAAELITTDPKLALQKAKELWKYLSEDEPENQARPTTLEQLLVLLTRESARRIVHMINFGANMAYNIPKALSHTTTEAVHLFIYFNNRFVRIIKLNKMKDLSKDEAETLYKRISTFYINLQTLTNTYLERLASYLSGRIEAEKISGSRIALPGIMPSSTQRHPDLRLNNNTATSYNNINGVY